MTTGNKEPDTELEILDPETTPLTLASGFPIKIQRLKTRALLALLKILTRGAGDLLFSLWSEDEDEFQGRTVAAIAFAIPEAPDEAIAFVRLMVAPADLKEGSLSKGEIKWNEDRQAELDDELDDPDPIDLITIITEVVRNEAPHMVALGKQLQALIRTQRPQTKPASKKPSASSKRASRNSTQTDSSAGTPLPTTS